MLEMSEEHLEKAENVVKKELFIWYFDRWLPVAAGKEWYGDKVRYYQLASSKVKVGGKGRVIVTVTSEAFGLLMWENCCDKWVKIWKKKKEEGKDAEIPRSKDDGALEYAGKWSDANSGQAKYGGWSDAAYERFEELKDLVKTYRDNDTTNGSPIHKYALKLMREKKGITAEEYNSKKSAKRKKKQAPKDGKKKRLTKLDE